MKKLLFIPMITIFGLMGCSKEKVAVSKTEQNQLIIPASTSVNDQLLTVRSEIMKELLAAARDSTFRTLVLNECLHQRNGDYYVRLIDLANSLEGHANLDYLRLRLIDFDSEVISLTQDRHPIVFYPRAETIEELLNQGASTISLQEPIGVFQEVYYEDYSSPGHVLDNNFSLIYNANITEEFAWVHDVWVIGEEEDGDLKDSIEASTESVGSTSGFRSPGRQEWGGIIQITNLNAVEHWTRGKPHLVIRVFNSSGTLVSHRDFGPRARRNFQNQTWCDFWHSIGNWNTSTFGNWMYENWIELDGGFTSSISFTFPPPPGTSGPSSTTTIPSRDGDDNLGLSTIQFTDPLTQIYNISHANIRRK